MNRLSALDAAFLYLESSETPMHIGSLTIFAPAAEPETLFERFREQTRARLSRLPSYYRRLKKTPFNIDHPVWVKDKALDLDYHIRNAALPAPGTMEQLREMVAELHAIPLDKHRPLWQYYMIEGLDDGGFAVYVKVHHSAMDGVAGLATLGVVYDFSPEPAPPATPKFEIPGDESNPDFLELTSTALADFIRQGLRAVGSVPALARTVAKMLPHLTRDARTVYSYAKGAPRTPLNVAIAQERAFATSSVPLEQAKALAKANDATINDLVLALCAGALRRYLSERKQLPKQQLVAAVPASLREMNDFRLNNQVMFAFAHLPTDLTSPLARLKKAREAMQDSKELFVEVKDLLTTDLSVLGAPILITALARLTGTRAGGVIPIFFNLVVSNVPGPRKALYCMGAPARHYFPVSIPYHNAALNITVQSYLDHLDFGLVACKAAVPDAQRIADLIAQEFEEMREEASWGARQAGDAKGAVRKAARKGARKVAGETAAPKRAARKAPGGKESARKATAKKSSAKKAAPAAPSPKTPAAKRPRKRPESRSAG